MTSKYHAKRTEYNGRYYDSGLEASIAKVLDNLKDPPSGFAKVLFCDIQVPFTLIHKSKWGRNIVYKADFVVIWGEQGHSQRTIIEVKGHPTPMWKLKERLFHERYPGTDLRVVSSIDDVMLVAREVYARYSD